MTAESSDLRELVDLVSRLRAPDGCPWDRRQGLDDLRAYLLEEAHETAAAIDAGDAALLVAELGDLLFQIAFVICLAEEAGTFDASDVVTGARDKMVARHPHVFGDAEESTVAEVARSWQRRKADHPDASSVLGGVPGSLPALVAAYRLTQKAAGVGFDWSRVGEVVDKVREELVELDTAVCDDRDESEVREEIGDLLFAVANLSRHLDVDPEGALAAANAKFRRRFGTVEEQIRTRGSSPSETSRQEMEALWQEAKRREPDR